MNTLRSDLNRSYTIIRTGKSITISVDRNRFGKDQSIVLVFGKESKAAAAEPILRQASKDWTSLHNRATENELVAIAYDYSAQVDFTEVM